MVGSCSKRSRNEFARGGSHVPKSKVQSGWADAWFFELADFVQSFQIVEGRVKETGERKRRVYLDFGEVWKHDLTAIIAGRDRKRFEAAGIDLLKLKGRKVRLRGWVERWNGPLLRLSEPEQIEFLDKASETPTAPTTPSIPIAVEPKAKSPG